MIKHRLKEATKAVAGKRLLQAYHATKSELASVAFGRPANGLTVIGVTGTNGKTTTVNIIASIFEAAGYKVALLSTIQFRISGEEWVNHSKMTVPEPFSLNRFIKRAKTAGCQIFVMEVTSIALDQNRVAGITYDTGVLTNITHDHLDYHGTFDRYVQAKRNLFARGLRLSVVNADDPNGQEFSQLPANLHTLYSLDADKEEMLRARNIREQDGQTMFDCVLPGEAAIIPIKSMLVGTFNVSNLLAAIGVALGHGISHDVIQKGIGALQQVPGRMEEIKCGQDFRVIIDYAHTPDALEKLYQALNVNKGAGRIISVLGSCGDRDKAKRPILGEIAGREAAYIFVTNEDPYHEDPQSIIDAVADGIPRGNPHHLEGASYWRVFDRREAMGKAFEQARAGDIVTITGKGAETAMMWGSEYRPWSDREVAKEELAKLGYRSLDQAAKVL